MMQAVTRQLGSADVAARADKLPHCDGLLLPLHLSPATYFCDDKRAFLTAESWLTYANFNGIADGLVLHYT